MRKSYCQLLMGVMGNVKSGGGSLPRHLTAMFRGKRGGYKRSKICGNQDARGQHEGAGSQEAKKRDPEGD